MRRVAGPLHYWLVALRETLRWLLKYDPPGEAAGGKVDVTVKPKESENG
jgi:hypothetical protein